MPLNELFMEQNVDIKSPFTGGRVKEVFTVEQMEYHGHTYNVHVRYYVCQDTGEKFTTTEQDQEWFDELQNMAKKTIFPYAETADNCIVVADGDEQRPQTESHG